MLSRRHLRLKALQSLYAYFLSSDFEITKSEKELFKSIEKIYDLYLSKLQFLIELRHVAKKIIEENKLKHLPSSEDLNPNLSFLDNKILILLEKNTQLNYLCNSRKINWGNDYETVKKIFNQVRESEEYIIYMGKVNKSFNDDLNFIVDIFTNNIAENEFLEFLYEEESIFWSDDFFLVNSMVIKTIKMFTEKSNDSFELLALYKDPEDEKEFVSKLFRYTIVNTDKYQEYIISKLKNWEPDRIAFMDMVIMKMALCELINFPSIPVKVTLNEYIELSKDYSTDKSKVFINGILDKLIADLKSSGAINKVGRGLLE
jgi:N utilization substance protein B